MRCASWSKFALPCGKNQYESVAFSGRSNRQFFRQSRVSEEKIQVGVAVVTRGRPNMLSNLLESWVALKVPDDASLQFIIVENDPVGTVGVAKAVSVFQDKLAASRLASPARVHFSVEPRLGIPYARNKALEIATDHECDFLAFTDDDCRVDSDWITGLLQVQKAEDADLVCGIVRYTADLENCNFFGKALAENMIASSDIWRERAHRADGAAIRGTGYWMVRMAFVIVHDLCFDEALSLAVGEDFRFYEDLIFAGGRHAITTDLHVEETIAMNRLMLKYGFARARANSIARRQYIGGGGGGGGGGSERWAQA